MRYWFHTKDHNRRILLFPILAVIIFMVAPVTFSHSFNIFCFIIHIIILLYFYKNNPRNNYFDYDTLFLVSYTITFFVYPVFLYPIDPHFFTMFTFEFNDDFINKSSALAVVGSSIYCYTRGTYSCDNNSPQLTYHLPVFRYVVLAYIVFALFVLAGGLSRLNDIYDSGMIHTTSISNYISVFLSPVIIILVVTQFYNSYHKSTKFRIQNFSVLFIVFVLLYSLLVLSTGSRGGVINLVLSVIWIFSFFYRKIRLIPLLIIVVSGALALALIGVFRADGDTSAFGFVDVFMDLIINNRNNFVAIEYVQDNGLTYGKSLLGNLLKVIPFLSGVVHNVFDLSIFETSSSMLLTAETLGEDFTLGLGTSILADLYLAFGLCGVICGFYILGRFVSYLENNLSSGSIYVMIAYATMISNSVFVVRSEFFYIIGKLVYAYVIFYIMSHLKFRN